MIQFRDRNQSATLPHPSNCEKLVKNVNNMPKCWRFYVRYLLRWIGVVSRSTIVINPPRDCSDV